MDFQLEWTHAAIFVAVQSEKQEIELCPVRQRQGREAAAFGSAERSVGVSIKKVEEAIEEPIPGDGCWLPIDEYVQLDANSIARRDQGDAWTRAWRLGKRSG